MEGGVTRVTIVNTPQPTAIETSSISHDLEQEHSIQQGVSPVNLGGTQPRHHNTKLARIHISTVCSHAGVRGNVVVHEPQEASLCDLHNLLLLHSEGVIRQANRSAENHVPALGEAQVLLPLGPKVPSSGRQASLCASMVVRHHCHVIRIDQLADRLVQALTLEACLRTVPLEPRPEAGDIHRIQDRAEGAALLDPHTNRESRAVPPSILHRILKTAVHANNGPDQCGRNQELRLHALQQH
jgi:hypothetical protein